MKNNGKIKAIPLRGIPRKYLNLDDAAKYLGLSKESFNTLRRNGNFTPIRLGYKTVIYELSELEEFMERKKNESTKWINIHTLQMKGGE